ncbi:MAG TPA: hypothetical protein DCY91_26375 [Cyanobacteria bacterium UBA11370]|nr:hypothetical protein [Cyanobacteria bacterium UBA11370]
MNKHFINALAVITAGSFGLSASILPPQARSQETTQSCEIGLLNSKNRIEQGRDITVTIDIIDGSEKYPDYPNGRPTIIFLFLDFPGSYGYRGYDSGGSVDDAVSVMESPVFQRAIASEIINSCNSVGAVTFVLKGQPPWATTTGLMRDGSIQNFECLLPDELPDDDSPFLPWGQELCSI